ncbi:MAG: hypothetical protein KAH03_03610 [Cocleimonas sp.]|nr:hypothetical protein [Cocleimonas sp.]
MTLTRQQLEDLYRHMEEVAKSSSDHEVLAKKSIRGTNRVIYIFTGLGAVLAGLIFYDFVFLNKAISRSLKSMAVMNTQVVELRHTMNDITSSIANMGTNVEYLQRISSSVNHITQATRQMNGYMGQLEQQTIKLGLETRAINLHASAIDQNFSQINHSVKNISYSVHQVVRPIKQFMPIP